MALPHAAIKPPSSLRAMASASAWHDHRVGELTYALAEPIILALHQPPLVCSESRQSSALAQQNKLVALPNQMIGPMVAASLFVIQNPSRDHQSSSFSC